MLKKYLGKIQQTTAAAGGQHEQRHIEFPEGGFADLCCSPFIAVSAELASTYAALILADEGIEISVGSPAATAAPQALPAG